MHFSFGKAKLRIRGFDVFVWMFAMFSLCIILFPLMYVVSLSFSGAAQVLQGNVTFFPKDFTLASYAEMMKSPMILKAYKNSILYTATSVSISMVLVTMTAYPLMRKDLPGRKILINMILFTMFFNGGIIPIYILLQNLGFMDKIWALVIPWAIPQFELFLLKNYFENTPEEIYEAAVVDGASEFRIMVNIYVPLAKPMFAALAVFFAMFQWNNYMVPLMYISSPSKYPLQLLLNDMLLREQTTEVGMMNLSEVTSVGLKNATIVLSVLPLLILYPFLQKYFIGSIYVGSIKG